MPIPVDKKEILGALIVASGLVLGGLILMADGRFGIQTPGLRRDEPVRTRVEAALVEGEARGVEVHKTSKAQGGARGESAARPEEEDGSLYAAVDRRGRRLGPVDLNRAGAKELEALDGVGPSLSRRIVQLRDRKGGYFRSIDELLEVKGIGPATLARIRPSATLGVAAQDSQNSVFRKSTSTQPDSSSLQR